MNEQLVAALESYRYPEASEAGLQLGVQTVLKQLGHLYEREVRLNAADRIDFMVGAIGIECKVNGTVSTVSRQLRRYCKCKRLESLILLTTRLQLAQVPRMLEGKRVAVAATMGGVL